MVEQSLVFIKPDGVKRRLMAEVIRRFEIRGFEFKRLELRQLTSAEVDTHYEEHVDKDFYPRLKEFILSGPILIMILEGDRVVDTVRKMVGPTDALDAPPGTIRGDLSLSKGENVVHASDSPESAQREIKNFLVRLFISLVIALVLLGWWFRSTYHQPVYFEAHWLESNSTMDSALLDPTALVSNRIDQPTAMQKDQTVCVLVHGFSASSFEFEDLKQRMLAKDPTLLFSSVVMGGHGRNYEAFRLATHEDWLAPIKKELQDLTVKGYKNVMLFGVSTGATGIMHLALTGHLDDVPIRQIILMDPYILPVNKSLHLVPWLKYIIPNTRLLDVDDTDVRHWYTNRPSQALHELLRLVKRTQANLRDHSGAFLAPVRIYTARHDPIADTRGADMILNALGADVVSIDRYESNHHVLIKPTTKKDWSDNDQRQYEQIINEIYSFIQ